MAKRITSVRVIGEMAPELGLPYAATERTTRPLKPVGIYPGKAAPAADWVSSTAHLIGGSAGQLPSDSLDAVNALKSVTFVERNDEYLRASARVGITCCEAHDVEGLLPSKGQNAISYMEMLIERLSFMESAALTALACKLEAADWSMNINVVSRMVSVSWYENRDLNALANLGGSPDMPKRFPVRAALQWEPAQFDFMDAVYKSGTSRLTSFKFRVFAKAARLCAEDRLLSKKANMPSPDKAPGSAGVGEGDDPVSEDGKAAETGIPTAFHNPDRNAKSLSQPNRLNNGEGNERETEGQRLSERTGLHRTGDPGHGRRFSHSPPADRAAA